MLKKLCIAALLALTLPASSWSQSDCQACQKASEVAEREKDKNQTAETEQVASETAEVARQETEQNG